MSTKRNRRALEYLEVVKKTDWYLLAKQFVEMRNGSDSNKLENT